MNTIYLLLLANLAFLVGLFFLFRCYIRGELNKMEHVRKLEQELRGLLLEVNRCAEEIIQIVEDRTARLQELLQQQEGWQHNAERKIKELRLHSTDLEQQQLRWRELQQNGAETLRSFQKVVQLHLQDLRQPLEASLQQSLEKKLHAGLEHRSKELLQTLIRRLESELPDRIREEWRREWQTALQSIEAPVNRQAQEAPQNQGDTQRDDGPSSQRVSTQLFQTKTEPPQARRLPPELRAEIEQYLYMGLDARIISRKTGVPLNLIEIMAGMRGQ